MREFIPPNLGDTDHLVIDTETDGLDWKKNRVVGYVITWGPNPDESRYFPTRHASGDNYDHATVTAWVKSLVDSGRYTFTGHHMKFDMHMLANEGIWFTWGQVSCTQNNAAIINENQRSYSLENCCVKMGVQEKKGEVLYKHLAAQFGCDAAPAAMAHFWELSADDMVANEYAAGDGTSTWQLEVQQKEVIEFQGLHKVYNLENDVLIALLRMERRGVPVNPIRFEELKLELDELLKSRLSILPPGMNVKSPKQVLQYLIDNGVDTDTLPKTKVGNYQLNEDTLLGIPQGKPIIDVRKIRTLQASFIEGQISKFVTEEGKIHTQFNQMKSDDFGVVTGRLSSNAPNLQQVPKRDPVLAPMFRSLFAAPPGMVWSSNDYSQQEYVVFAEYSGSKRLQDGYNNDPPVDIHSFVAIRFTEMLGREVDRNFTAKRLNLGKLYGMGVDKLALKLGISRQEAQKLSNMWDKDVCPEGKKFLKTADANATNSGYVYDLIGRRRRYEIGDNTYSAGNAVIQMSSASITKSKMVEVEKYFESQGGICQLVLQVHDELDWFFPDNDEGRRQDEEARRIMADFGPGSFIELGTRLRVDHSEGPNWGVASFGED